MRYTPRTKVKQDNQRGAEVMSYLFDQYSRNNPELANERDRTAEGKLRLPSLEEHIRFSPLSDTQSSDENGHKLRLLNKFSNDVEDGDGDGDEAAAAAFADAATKPTPADPNEPSKSFFHTPISSMVSTYRRAVGSPLVDSAITGLGLGGLAYGVANYFNPVTDKQILERAVKILKAKKGPITAEAVKQAKKAAKSELLRTRRLVSGAIGLAGAGLNSWYHYVPGKPESLYKWASIGVPKKASMLSPGSFMPVSEVKAAVMDSSMTDGNKFLAMGMLDTIGKPAVSSDDIIGAAINTGVSALGSPIGRYTVAAAAEAALGYGIGSALGVSRPERTAMAMGLGSFLSNTLQPIHY